MTPPPTRFRAGGADGIGKGVPGAIEFGGQLIAHLVPFAVVATLDEGCVRRSARHEHFIPSLLGLAAERVRLRRQSAQDAGEV